jgi:hypothetical protein
VRSCVPHSCPTLVLKKCQLVEALTVYPVCAVPVNRYPCQPALNVVAVEWSSCHP